MFVYLVRAAFAIALTMALSSSLRAQLIAFPGAEGAGKYATGGRNGDIYVVSNLNNSGTGSLRHAVDTAPATGRMIVFSVGGTIDLLSDIRVDSPNITIAGQTAPGGITLAQRALNISDTTNVIVQHIAVRPGDFATAPSVYEPDSLSVWNAQNVMVDHVSASWGTDEVLSVSHGASNVTVQWSMITEALHNSNHSKGNHGYGGIIHGGKTTLHHNLYAHNRSRNPATGDSTPDARLDIVNNVIFNPGGYYSYSGTGDQYQVNWTGNFGIEGPNTTKENELFHPDNVESLVYYENNYYDTEEDGILQLTPASPRTMTGLYTRLTSPVETTYPPIQTDAPTAYAQVLSYAGAAAHRDPIDKRVINSVIRQNGAHIDSQNQVGGWYRPAPTTIAVDPDGLPDWWKIEKHLNPDDNTLGRQKPIAGGYTYLEMYLHELSAPFLPATETDQIVVSTAYGNGADATVTENGGVAGGNGGGNSLAARWTNSNQNEVIELRFDLSAVKRGSVASAALELTAFQAVSNQTFRVYGLEHAAPDQEWSEASVTFDTAPGLAFDGNAATRGRVADELLLLGDFNTGVKNEGDTISFTNPDLIAFLNLLAYRSAGPEGLVTILLERQTTSSVQTLFASKEATQLASGQAAGAGAFAPRLALEAVALAVPVLSGDFNDDGVVDAADYTVWRDTMNTNTALPNETVTLGVVDADDYDEWRANFGASSLGASELGTSVPEPAGMGAAFIGFTLFAIFKRRRSSASGCNYR